MSEERTQMKWQVVESTRTVVWDQPTGVYFLLEADGREVTHTRKADVAMRWIGA